MKTVTMGGEHVPKIAQGTWHMGEDPRQHTQEVDALRYGINQGLTLIDTAEMYAEGGAEKVVGEAISDMRDEVFLVSKVWPNHQSPEQLPRALDKSRKRLGCDYLDLYLLHWPSRDYPLQDTLTALANVQAAGLTRYIGLSNFPTPYFIQAQNLLGSRAHLVADQVEYHLTLRSAETTLIPYAMGHHIAVMGYSPLKHMVRSNLSQRPWDTLQKIAISHGVSPYTVALAALIRFDPVVVIAKAVSPQHIDHNRAALDLQLAPKEWEMIDQAFPPSQQELAYHPL